MAIPSITNDVAVSHDGEGGVIFTWYYHEAGSSAQCVRMAAIARPLLQRLADPLAYMEQVIDNGKARIKPASCRARLWHG
jgi:hypothetical protein